MAGVFGSWLKAAILEVQEYVLMIGKVGRALVTRPFYHRDIIEQFEAIGVGSLTVVLLTGLFTGMVLALQSGFTLDQFGARSMVGRLVSASMVKELGPVLTGLMVAGRVGSGIAAELGSMMVTDQIAALRALGTDPIRARHAQDSRRRGHGPAADGPPAASAWSAMVRDGVSAAGRVFHLLELRRARTLHAGRLDGVDRSFFLGFAIVSIGCHVACARPVARRASWRSTTNAVVVSSAAVIAVDFLGHQNLDHADVLMATGQLASRSPLLDEAPPPERLIIVRQSLAGVRRKGDPREVSFTLQTGHTKIFLGASGAGKSTILRLSLGLLKPDQGRIFVNGEEIDGMSEDDLMAVRADLGMVFQEGALFDSLTVRENVGYKLFAELDWPADKADARVMEVLGFIGLAEFADRMPSELSGGQRRRVAIARAMAAKPRILLYDEPTTGLDPITALTVDQEIVKLRDLEGVSSILVTHQLRDAFFVAEHTALRNSRGMTFERAEGRKANAEFIMLRDGRIAFEGHAQELREAASQDAYIEPFLS